MSDVRPLDQAKVDAALAALACRQGDHRWKFIGCRACSCEGEYNCCSIPVHECEECGDCDYGINDEGAEIAAECTAERAAA